MFAFIKKVRSQLDAALDAAWRFITPYAIEAGKVCCALPGVSIRLFWRLVGRPVVLNCCRKCDERKAQLRVGPHMACRHVASCTSFARTTVLKPERPCAGAFFIINRGGRSSFSSLLFGPLDLREVLTGRKGAATRETGWAPAAGSAGRALKT